MSGTREGIILGTAAGISPEQARGKPVDKRTDIWDFGRVLDEMLTRQAAFDGETLSDLIAAIYASPTGRSCPTGLILESTSSRGAASQETRTSVCTISPTPALKSTMSLLAAAQALCQFSLACVVASGERFGL